MTTKQKSPISTESSEKGSGNGKSRLPILIYFLALSQHMIDLYVIDHRIVI